MAHDDVPIKPMGNVNFDNANDSRNDGVIIHFFFKYLE
jgi:hypothetical protein